MCVPSTQIDGKYKLIVVKSQCEPQEVAMVKCLAASIKIDLEVSTESEVD